MAGRGLGGAEDAAGGGGCAYSLLDSTRRFSNCKCTEFTLQRTFLPHILYSLIAVGYLAFCEWKRENWPERKLRRKRSGKCTAHLKVHTHLSISPSPPPPRLRAGFIPSQRLRWETGKRGIGIAAPALPGPHRLPSGTHGKGSAFHQYPGSLVSGKRISSLPKLKDS